MAIVNANCHEIILAVKIHIWYPTTAYDLKLNQSNGNRTEDTTKNHFLQAFGTKDENYLI